MSSWQSSPTAEADARSLAEKLAEFSKSLTPGEAEALQQLIQSWKAQDDDVQGYAAWSPTEANWWWSQWNWQD